MVRSPLLAVGFVTLVLVFVPAGAHAHAGGSGPIAVAGSFVLDGAPSLGDAFHAFLSDMGIPGHGGETLRYFWSANNGSGPEVYFEIHDHAPPAGFRIYYSTTDVTESGEWAIPGSEDYMVFWQNQDTEPLEVQYSFSLLGAPPDYTGTIITLVAVGGFFAVLWFIWRGKATPKEEPDAPSEQMAPPRRRLP